jgi:hypothetical protein
MSGKVSGWVWDQDLPQNEKYVLLAYADHADHAGNNIYPGIKLIVKKTGYSRRSVQRITQSLLSKGYIVPQGGQKGGRGVSAKWSIPVNYDKMAPIIKGDTGDVKGDTGDVKGDIALAPEPSEPLIKPSGIKGGKKRPPAKRKRDIRLDHPAIIAYREEARLHVPVTWRDDVIETIDDAERWQRLVHSWIGKGWNKQNIEGMLEAYRNGGIGRNNKPKAMGAIEKAMAKRGMINGD